jgi:ketosteroid isomerase-like protein
MATMTHMILAVTLLLGIQSNSPPQSADTLRPIVVLEREPANGQVAERLLVVLPGDSANDAAERTARDLARRAEFPLEVTAVAVPPERLAEFERWCTKGAHARRIVYATPRAESVAAQFAARRPDSIAVLAIHAATGAVATVDGVEFVTVGANPALDPGDEVIATVRAARVAKDLDDSERRQVGSVLDDFHTAAAAADLERYFGHFAPDGVFLGTDANERWTVAQFRAYCEPYFSQGKGWKYEPRSTNVDLGANREYAWFDQLLWNAKYGECRGSGVLRRTATGWKIQQYNLVFTVPNDKAARVVEVIREK